MIVGFGNDVQAAKLRQLVGLYRQAMGLPEDKRIPCNFASTQQRVEVLLVFFQWLTRFPATTFTPCVQRIIQSLIEELVLAFDCTIFRPTIEKRLRQWANLKTPSRTVIDQESDWPADSRRWLRRLSHYRQLAGKETQFPKSLKRPFALNEKRASEIAFLQSCAQSGQISASQQARFDYLTARQDDASDAVPALRAHRQNRACWPDWGAFSIKFFMRQLKKSGIAIPAAISKVGPRHATSRWLVGSHKCRRENTSSCGKS